MLVNGLIGKKIGMTQLFLADGTVVPVTVLQAGPCVVTALKTPERDGYSAAQLALVEPGKARLVNKALKGHFDKAKVAPSRTLREFKALGELKVGDALGVTEFDEGELVDVRAVSKGKGFQGVMRRHNFAGGAGAHGSMFHRAPGSIGASAFPSRVFKGMRAPGQMGAKYITTKNLKVVRVDADKNLLIVRGAVPGPEGGTLRISRAKAGVRKKTAPAAAK